MPDDTRVPAGAEVTEERAVDDQPAEAALAGDPEKLRAKLQVLEAQLEESFKRSRETSERLKETHERFLRTAAEFENYKKRAVKEKEDTQKFGVERLLKDFLPVMDNLERALDHAEQHDLKQVIEGVRLVQKLFETTLARHGVTGFSAVGKPFDPSLHGDGGLGDGARLQAARSAGAARGGGCGQTSHPGRRRRRSTR